MGGGRTCWSCATRGSKRFSRNSAVPARARGGRGKGKEGGGERKGGSEGKRERGREWEQRAREKATSVKPTLQPSTATSLPATAGRERVGEGWKRKRVRGGRGGGHRGKRAGPSRADHTQGALGGCSGEDVVGIGG
eukprot:2607706-Rhodomonas_salina.2